MRQTSFLVATPDAFGEPSEKVLDALKFSVPVITLDLFKMIFERYDFEYADLKSVPELWLFDPDAVVSKVIPGSGAEPEVGGAQQRVRISSSTTT